MDETSQTSIQKSKKKIDSRVVGFGIVALLMLIALILKSKPIHEIFDRQSRSILLVTSAVLFFLRYWKGWFIYFFMVFWAIIAIVIIVSGYLVPGR